MGDVALEVEVAACINAIVDQAGGSVAIGRGELIHRLDGSRAIAGLGDQGLIIAGDQLVEQVVPLGVVVIQTTHIDQAEAVVLAVDKLIGQVEGSVVFRESKESSFARSSLLMVL